MRVRLHSKIVRKYSELLRKVIGTIHMVFLIEHPIFEHRFEKYSKNESMYIRSVIGLNCACSEILQFFVNFSISKKKIHNINIKTNL